MARPKLKLEEKKRHQINIRLNDAEMEFAKIQSELCGLELKKWIIKSAFSKRTLPADIHPESKKIYIQLVRIGTNLNQISKMNNAKLLDFVLVNELIKEIKLEMNTLKDLISNDK